MELYQLAFGSKNIPLSIAQMDILVTEDRSPSLLNSHRWLPLSSSCSDARPGESAVALPCKPAEPQYFARSCRRASSAAAHCRSRVIPVSVACLLASCHLSPSCLRVTCVIAYVACSRTLALCIWFTVNHVCAI